MVLEQAVVAGVIFRKLLCVLVSVLLGVAFVTLYERKLLSRVQLREGPVKTGYKGLFQPFRDAVKLFRKEFIFPEKRAPARFSAPPLAGLFLMLVLWVSLPSWYSLAELSLGVIYVICCLRVGVYYMFGAGVVSGRKFSGLGGVRAVAQTLSYEVSYFLILLTFILLVGGFSFLNFFGLGGRWFIRVSPFLGGVWLVSRLAETNRTPFDFREGESELVSGFNTEYRSGAFAIFFLREYGFIIFMRVLFSVIFLGGLDGVWGLTVKTMLGVHLFV